MKFTIPSSLLSARLQTIGRVIVQKNTMPILDSFMFDIQGSRLVVTAGDNETVLTTAIDVTDCDSDIRFARPTAGILRQQPNARNHARLSERTI